ncbi:membrane-bound mannosyltransferase [Halanaeroarchaeum sulfurireducens]|uniref:Membrane-bound mannosyltransferase n=2 Tax=Halanaeroarchaeum sulfurireducens TaxID=1604004 RepID=A0A0F7PC44_9EURY|nr:membrane-bound mannosyltransferase [Halanaeroarchaeum sulfurireducens]
MKVRHQPALGPRGIRTFLTIGKDEVPMDVPALNRDRTTLGVLGIAVLAAVVRLVGLGTRVFHWDEARIGYWILQYMETGLWNYRPVVHGPFLFHTNDVLFQAFGPTDFVARVAVAVVGALLPLAALLFRERLEHLETLVLAAFLAFNPVLLYYSRFMRNDVLVAAFAFVALGSFVRLIDTGRSRYLYVGSGLLALAATTKGIVVVYLVIWVGTLVLVADSRLLVARFRGGSPAAVARDYASSLAGRLERWALPLWIAVVEFLVVFAVLYAPRPELYQAFGDPTRLLGVVEAATVDVWWELWDTWIAADHEHSYVDFLLADAKRLSATSLVVTLFGILGFLVDRYGRRRSRDVIIVGFAWAAGAFLIFPAVTNISAAWGLVHTVVPLAIPAAVGVGVIVEKAARLRRLDDRVGAVAISIVVLLATAQVGVTAYQTSFASPQSADNPLVQYGQPAGHLQETLSDVERIADSNTGTDVLFYGDQFYVANESRPSAGENWSNRLPVSWYLERADAEVESTMQVGGLSDPPPVVIARASDYSEVNAELDGYEALAYELTATGTETVFFLDRSALPESG